MYLFGVQINWISVFLALCWDLPILGGNYHPYEVSGIRGLLYMPVFTVEAPNARISSKYQGHRNHDAETPQLQLALHSVYYLTCIMPGCRQYVDSSQLVH